MKTELIQNHTNKYETLFVIGEKSPLKEAFIHELQTLRRGDNATPYELVVLQHNTISENVRKLFGVISNSG